MRLGLQHSYCGLPSRFYVRVDPTPVARPQLAVFNEALAKDLGLDPALQQAAAAVLSGNELPEDANGIAMAYAGHQFGAFVPRLGDGRAILLGEHTGRDGVVRDIQLKGAGLTQFSRSGDGRAALGPMLREYLVSEAMQALGIPTTRSLAVVTTGEQVYRSGPVPGAILTRVASSHIRVGTFQYFAARGDQEALRELLDYVVGRHYPRARTADSPALAVLEDVTRRQASLIAKWMLVGFIHGVMNTDNMAISGETLDYGPCAFMDDYAPHTVFSSIDQNGRYAYDNQPAIAQWNLARLAETLLPLIHADQDRAIALATDVIDPFMASFDTLFLEGMCRKIGLVAPLDGDAELVRDLLAVMHRSGADFTLTFRRLAALAANPTAQPQLVELFSEASAAEAWLPRWLARLGRDPQTSEERAASMRAVNPAFIPRNHRVEAALDAAQGGDFAPFHKLLAVLRQPYAEQANASEYQQPPMPQERVTQTFCGT